MKRVEYSNKENAPKRLNELAAVQQDVAGTNQTIPTPPNVPANNTINEKTMPERNTGLSVEQIRQLREMQDIRNTNQPQHTRLDDFNEHQSPANVSDEMIPKEQITVINGQQVRGSEEIAAALVEAYGPSPELYGFEKNEPKPISNEPSKDTTEDLER